MFRQVLTSSTQPQIWSNHGVVKTRTAKKCTKMQNARAELLFLLIKPIVLWRSRSRHRPPYLKAGFHMIADDRESQIVDRRKFCDRLRSYGNPLLRSFAIVCDPAIVIADDRRR